MQFEILEDCPSSVFVRFEKSERRMINSALQSALVDVATLGKEQFEPTDTVFVMARILLRPKSYLSTRIKADSIHFEALAELVAEHYGDVAFDQSSTIGNFVWELYSAAEVLDHNSEIVNLTESEIDKRVNEFTVPSTPEELL